MFHIINFHLNELYSPSFVSIVIYDFGLVADVVQREPNKRQQIIPFIHRYVNKALKNYAEKK